jgi:hypothetical protein
MIKKSFKFETDIEFLRLYKSRYFFAQKAHQTNVMKQKLVYLRFGFLLSVFFFVLSSAECQAQKNASRKAEKELFGKTGKSKQPDDKIRAKGAAGKAMREQEKKEARREKEDEKNIEKLRKRHVRNTEHCHTGRMANNGKKTEASYKSKTEAKEGAGKPELKQTEQPKPPKDQAN